MRAAISLLVSSLVFGPLASNCQAMDNHLTSRKSVDDSATFPKLRRLPAIPRANKRHLLSYGNAKSEQAERPVQCSGSTFQDNWLLSMPAWQKFLSAQSDQNPDDAPRHRGSGRREVMQKFAKNFYAIV
ncbi:heterocyst-inhibiting protein PatX [Nostoc sp. 2RC]|uniref:heterocyst-inhibiting protein PatX n=1 Tax=Nostoc sp. 2RC TaxID=2485484 RepID=UPI001628B5BA|nr:hypothetical protein [Nostoc sp. 2RC]MBC1236844.1 hypothetical protein [Nostoc sp. 2RC]